MTENYHKRAFTDAVRTAQREHDSEKLYAWESKELGTDWLGEAETAFIESRDSFYMASYGSNDWPYLQHRGGPAGFLKVVSDQCLVMPDFRGNRQYISIGNFAGNDRVSLFFMDYPRRARLKVFARAKVFDIVDRPDLETLFDLSGYRAKIERGIEFAVEAFDWNCSQHIVPRFTELELQSVTAHLVKRIHALEAELAMLKK